MAQNQIDPEDVGRSMRALMDEFAHARTPTLREFAEAHAELAARLAGEEQRLTSALGTAHPKVLALRASAAAAAELKAALATMAERASRLPVPEENEWMVYGRVMDPEGKPVAGARVRVFDRDRKYDDLLGDTVTDEFGDFAVVYNERDFAEAGEQLPELYVMVQDAEGRLLHSSRASVRAKGGRAEHFEIVLAEAPAGAEKARKVPPTKPETPSRSSLKAKRGPRKK